MSKKGLILIVVAAFLLGIVQPAVAASDLSQAVGDHFQAGVIQGIALFNWPFLSHIVSDPRLQKSKAGAINGINAIVQGLNAAKNGVSHSKLPDNKKAELMSGIDTNITWFESEKSAIQSSNDLNDVNQQIKQTVDRWNDIKVGLKKEFGIAACDDMDAKLNNARNASAIVSQKIQDMKANGNDTGVLERSLASYNAHIDNASAHSTNARGDFNSINSTGNVDKRYAGGLSQLGMAQNELKGSFSDLLSIYRLVYRDNNITA